MTTIAVVGASGFVGQAVAESLRKRGYQVLSVRAPRLTSIRDEGKVAEKSADLQAAISASKAVINCAGLPDATGGASDNLTGANAVLPGLIAQIASAAGVRFVHVSTGAVQGRRPSLDASREVEPFSPYSQSKAAGEIAALAYPETIVYRPPGVHGADRPVTRTIAKIAKSPLATVSGSGTDNSAQALIGNVADAIAFLATQAVDPPPIVHHPSEGLTTASLLEALGGKPPRRVPKTIARAIVGLAFALGKVKPALAGGARRLEMLWFGQDQSPSWLIEAGWSPPQDRTAWLALGKQLEHNRKENPWLP